MVDASTKPVELVLFVGPPFSGKTLYYVHHLHDSHERISPQEIYSDGSKKVRSLPQLVVHVIGILKQGKSVVIDDINWSSSLRASYFTKVRAKLPNVACRCLVFKPQFTLKQCLWSRMWTCAYQACDGGNRSLRPLDVAADLVDIYLGLWFAGERDGGGHRRPLLRQTAIPPPDIPTSKAGGDVTVDTVTSLLSCESLYEWSVPVLLLQTSAIAHVGEVTNAVVLDDSITQACCEWAKKEPTGRLILLADNVRVDGAQERQKFICQAAEQLAMRLTTHPVYFLFIDGAGMFGDSSLPPRPGCIAWLQHAHMLSLSHNSSTYVWSTAEHRTSADVCGLYTFKSERLASKPLSLVAVKFNRPELPPYLRSMRLLCPRVPSSNADPTKAQLPLIVQAHNAGCGLSTMAQVGLSCWHGLAWPSVAALDEYQARWRASLTPMRPLADNEKAWHVDVGTTPTLPRAISLKKQSSFRHAPPLKPPISVSSSTSGAATEPMVAKRPAASTTRLPHRAVTAEPVGPGFLPPESLFVDTQQQQERLVACSPGDLELVVVSDVRRVAAAAKIYSNGSVLCGRVDDLQTRVLGVLLSISARVEGSNRERYVVKADVDGSGAVPSFSCTCPFHNRRERTTGSCKHVVAMLLEFNNQQAVHQQHNRQDQQQTSTSTRPPAAAAAAAADQQQQHAQDDWDGTVPTISSDELLSRDISKSLSKPSSKTSSVKCHEVNATDKPTDLDTAQKDLDSAGRSLPTWLASTQVKAHITDGTAATTAGVPAITSLSKRLDFVSPLKRKTSKKRLVAEQLQVSASATEYRLSESELLLTARVILKESTRQRRKRVARKKRPRGANYSSEEDDKELATGQRTEAPKKTDLLCVASFLQELSKGDSSDEETVARNAHHDKPTTSALLHSQSAENDPKTSLPLPDALDEFFAAVPDLSPVHSPPDYAPDTSTVIAETVAMADGEERSGATDLLNLLGNPVGKRRRQWLKSSDEAGDGEESLRYSPGHGYKRKPDDSDPTCAAQVLSEGSQSESHPASSRSSNMFLHDGRSDSTELGHHCLLPGGRRLRRVSVRPSSTKHRHATTIVPETLDVPFENLETQITWKGMWTWLADNWVSCVLLG